MKRVYRECSNKHYNKPHNSLSAVQITELFVSSGIIGRQRPGLLTLVVKPVIEKGPGFSDGR